MATASNQPVRSGVLDARWPIVGSAATSCWPWPAGDLTYLPPPATWCSWCRTRRRNWFCRANTPRFRPRWCGRSSSGCCGLQALWAKKRVGRPNPLQGGGHHGTDTLFKDYFSVPQRLMQFNYYVQVVLQPKVCPNTVHNIQKVWPIT